MSVPTFDPGFRAASRLFSLSAVLAFLALLTLGATDVAAQQTGTVTGTVTNTTSGDPIVGAQVQVAGTNIGQLTNNRGRFVLLNVPAGQRTVRAVYIGYGSTEQSVSVPAGGSVTVDLSMRSEAISLEGVVVTGTAGSARRREIGNAISQINATEIETAAIADMGDVLQGRSSGVMITDNSGMVGAGSTIRLRGNSSIQSHNYPLVYVDGVRMETHALTSNGDEEGQQLNAIDMINPNDIERIEIVKGPAATTLYGTEAAAGVIQVFTKRGASGSPQWTLSIDQGIHNMGHVGPDESINPTGLRMNDCSRLWGYDRDANEYAYLRDADTGELLSEPGCPESGSWFKNGHVQRYNLSVRGGTETFSYFASGRWGRQIGVIAPNEAEDYGIRANFSFSPADNLTFSLNNAYSRRDVVNFPDGNNADGLILNVLRGPWGYTTGNRDDLLLDMQLIHQVDHYTTGLQVSWNPVPSITQRLNVGVDYTNADFQDFKPWGFVTETFGAREDDQNEDRNLTFDYAGTWSTDLGDFMDAASAFSSSLSWGAQFYDEYSYGLNGFDDHFAGPGDQLLGDGTDQDVGESRTRIRSGGFFLQEMLGWRDNLFVTVGARWDGFSTFGENIDFEMYPKVSAAYTISDEPFFPDWGNLKLRMAWGESGRAPGVFDAQTIYEATSGDDGEPALIIGNLGNPDLGPERTEELEWGFEGSVWDGRVSFDFTKYDQTTTDALDCVSPPASTGIAECAWSNVGTIDNFGWEASVNFLALQTDNFDWEVGGRYAQQENEIVDLGEVDNLGDTYTVGYPFPRYFNDYVDNIGETGALPVMSQQHIGPQYPTDLYSISTRLTFMNNLSLDILGEGQKGHFQEVGTAYQTNRRGLGDDGLGEWPSCWPIQDALDDDNQAFLSGVDPLWRARCDPEYWDYGVWTMPADFFKIRSATLSYRLPDDLIPGVRNTTIRLQGRNLWRSIGDYEGLDPEAVDDGGDLNRDLGEYYNLPPTRTFMLNVTVNF